MAGFDFMYLPHVSFNVTLAAAMLEYSISYSINYSISKLLDSGSSSRSHVDTMNLQFFPLFSVPIGVARRYTRCMFIPGRRNKIGQIYRGKL